MRTKKHKRLGLAFETVRSLEVQDLVRAIGGIQPTPCSRAGSSCGGVTCRACPEAAQAY